MLEKVMEKIAMVEVMRDLAYKIDCMKTDYESQINSANENISKDDVAEWLKESYAKDIAEYNRKISALEKISDSLAKLI